MGRYFRLVVPRRHAASHQKAGVFCAASRLRERGDLSRVERDLLGDLLGWFDAHLPVPAIAQVEAVFWFRGEANACTRRIWELA